MPFGVSAPRGALLVAALCVAVVGIVIVTLYLPSATIYVTPATVRKESRQTITLTNNEEADFMKLVVPARVVTHEGEFKKRFVRQAGQVEESFAEGKVRLINERIEPQSLVPQTHLRHEVSGQFFLTQAAVTIPAQGEVLVAVKAKEAGSAGEVAPGKFMVDKLSPALQNQVYAVSDSNFQGGIKAERPLQEEEINRAKAETADEARQTVRGELSGATGGATLKEELILIEINEQIVPVKVGSAAAEFEIITRAHGRAFVAEENDLVQLNLIALRNLAEAQEEFVAFEPASFQIKSVRPDFNRGQALIESSLAGTFAAKLEAGVFTTTNLPGRSPAEVKEYFEQFPSVGKVEVELWPFWVSTIPSRTSATKIIVRNPSS